LVEHAQQTLVGLARATDEGGGYWASHLPFYLLTIRSSHNRVTHLSPSAILYGRELRFPAQLSDPRTTAETAADVSLPSSVREYASKLQNRMKAAWTAAREATLAAQSDTVGETTRTKDTRVSFKVGDRVCRLLPGHANKLEYFYLGPYRVTEVLPAGKYGLTDLENRIVRHEVHVSNLKRYYTVTDLVPLQPNEYIVDSLIDRRDLGVKREYRVKWRRYRLDESTWDSRTELLRRCADFVYAYDAKPVAARTAKQVAKHAKRAEPTVVELPDATRDVGRFSLRKRAQVDYLEKRAVVNAIYHPLAEAEDQETTVYAPLSANFARGEWYYRDAANRMGSSWPARTFSADELDSPPFSEARAKTLSTAGPDATLYEVAALLLSLDPILGPAGGTHNY